MFPPRFKLLIYFTVPTVAQQHLFFTNYTFADGLSNNEVTRLTMDRVVMDINHPGITGIECIAGLKPLDTEIQYLVCTVFEDNTNLFNALCAGATGYILKSASEEEFNKAIHDIHKGGSPMSPQIARMVVTAFPRGKATKLLYY